VASSALAAPARRWWRWRDEDGYGMHRFATDMGAAGPSPPLAAQFMRDVAVDDEAAKGLLQVLNHDIPPSQFLTVRRLLRAVAHAVRDRPAQIPAMVREAASEARGEARRFRRRRRQARAFRLPR
jgi:hypothetical protein